MTDTSPQGASDVSGLLLAEARELRNKQDARLANIQRQSQLVAAGSLAVAAIVVASASAIQPNSAAPAQSGQPSYVIPIIVLALTSATYTGFAWFGVHRIPRRWREGPNSFQLLRVYGSGGLRPLRERLIRMCYEDFKHNERLIKRCTIVVSLQMLTALLYLSIVTGYLVAVFFELQ